MGIIEDSLLKSRGRGNNYSDLTVGEETVAITPSGSGETVCSNVLCIVGFDDRSCLFASPRYAETNL
jgi:hypothetical protein